MYPPSRVTLYSFENKPIRLQLTGRREVCVQLEVTAHQLLPLLFPAPPGRSAAARGSVGLRTASSVHPGEVPDAGAPLTLCLCLCVNPCLTLRHGRGPVSFYCSGSNNTSPSGPCFPGFYCTGGSASPVQNEAGEGHYSLEGAVRAEPCPLGTFQSV